MKVKLGSFVNEQFRASFTKLRGSDLKATVAFKLMNASRAIDERLKHYNEVRLGICNKYAIKGEDGEPVLLTDPESGDKQYQFDHNGAIDFQKEHFDLLQEEVELPDPVIKIDDLKDVDLKVTDLEALVGMVIAN